MILAPNAMFRRSASLAGRIAAVLLAMSAAFAEPAQAGVSSATETPSALSRLDYKFSDKSENSICKGER